MVEENSFLDRRTFERIPVELALQFSEPTSNKEGLALTRDISAKGICLLTEESLLPNTSLEMWLQVPNCENRIHTRGKVVWLEEFWSNQNKVGISLDKTELVKMSIILRNLIQKRE